MRKASINRKTKETSINISVNIDGTGNYDINTGNGFFDHMLEQLSYHSLIDIELCAKGDLYVDAHHTSEDTGIILGQAIAKALGECRGIRRYASINLPMDETLTRAAIDISGRAYLVWKVEFSRDKIGNYDTELFRDFFQALVSQARITLHMENLYGVNNHHIAESCFKAFARALRMAIELDSRQKNAIPSTKDTL